MRYLKYTHAVSQVYACGISSVRMRYLKCTHAVSQVYACGISSVRMRYLKCTHAVSESLPVSLPVAVYHYLPLYIAIYVVSTNGGVEDTKLSTNKQHSLSQSAV
jgi:hypothetical protein